MSTRTALRPNTYIDSVSLMSISTKANELPGVQQAFAAMGTVMNKEVLKGLGLLVDDLVDASPGDLMLVVATDDTTDADAALGDLGALLVRSPNEDGKRVESYRTISAAAAGRPEANLAVVSVNGAFAAGQAREALEHGMHVLLFSDNVSIEDEVSLKQLAHDKGLLMMGPDCGTAIIGGVALCFANTVRRGSIGIVGASGTGSQEMSVRIHDFGAGVSQLIGTGGRDLSEQVGGSMMFDALSALEADPATSVIVLVSKPPADAVARQVIERAARTSKPVIVCFLGASDELIAFAAELGVTLTSRTKPAALEAVVASGVQEDDLDLHALNWPLVEEVRAKLAPEQRYIRGLFAGGTLCDEAMFLAMETHPQVYSNLRRGEFHLGGSDASRAHTFLDLGDDEFTNGKPHPMIDPSNRVARFLTEAADPEVGVIVMDFVLGFGAHEDPVGVMLPAIREAKERAAAQGRHLEILAYVLGTDQDPQDLAAQIAALEEAGVTIASSSTNTGLLAREFVVKGATA